MNCDMIGPAIVLGLGCIGSAIGCGIAGMAAHSRFGIGLADLVADFFQLVELAPDESHRCPQAHQFVRGAAPNAAAAAGHDDNLSREQPGTENRLVSHACYFPSKVGGVRPNPRPASARITLEHRRTPRFESGQPCAHIFVKQRVHD